MLLRDLENLLPFIMKKKGDYVDELIYGDRYIEEYKNLLVEEFEIEDIESKSDYIQNLIKDEIEELQKNQFAIDWIKKT